MPAERSAAVRSPRSPRPIGELDVVTVLVPVRTDEGEAIAAGTEGTVVAVWAGGAAFDIEFDAPVLGLATVESGSVARRDD